VIASVINLQRISVAFVYKMIKEWNAENNKSTRVNDQFIDFILEKLEEHIKHETLLEDDGCVHPNSVFPVALNYYLTLNENNEDFFTKLRSSFYISVNNNFPFPAVLYAVLPEISFLHCLMRANGEGHDHLTINSNFVQILTSMYNEFRNIIQRPDSKAVNSSLKTIFYDQLRLKFCCLFAATYRIYQTDYSLRRFFCLSAKDYNKSKQLGSLMRTKILIPTSFQNVEAESFGTLLHQDPISFLNNLKALYRPDAYVQIIRLNKVIALTT
jgi:hypothetical protein